MAEADGSGAERAFARLHRERYASLVGLARLLLDDASRAEQTVSEAFARALVRSSDEPHDPCDLVRRQIVGLSRNRLKSGFGSREAGHDREIAQALGGLKHLDLEALVLRHYEGLDDEAGADVLGLDPAAFDECVRSAMAAMPAHLEPREVPAALRAEARTTEVRQPPWADVLDEATRVRGRRRWVGVLAVLALGAAITVAGLTSDWFGLTGAGHVNHSTVPITTSDPPGHMLVVTADGVMQIIRSSDGDVVRTVRRGLEPSRAPVVATPDGRYAYIDQPVEDGECEDGLEIVRIDLSSGETDVVTAGRSPALSHDGSHLAFAETTRPERCGLYDTLSVRELDDGSQQSWSQQGMGVTYIRWSNDDSKIAFTLLDESGYRNVEWEAAEFYDGKSTSLDLRHGNEPVGYLADNNLLALYSESDRVELLVPHEDGDQLIAQRKDVSIDLSSVAVDRRGEHILWREARPRDRGRLAAGRVIRLAIGDRPAEVADGIVLATWLERLVEAR